jgi:hypothetical protein
LFKGTLSEKIIKLAAHIGEEPVSNLDKILSKNNTGDGQLDIVCWLPTGDNLNHKLVYFAQCACGAEDWERKQHEASPSNWTSKIHLKHDPVNMMFIPFHIKADNDSWSDLTKIKRVVMIDRSRFLFYLPKISGEALQRLTDIVDALLECQKLS